MSMELANLHAAFKHKLNDVYSTNQTISRKIKILFLNYIIFIFTPIFYLS